MQPVSYPRHQFPPSAIQHAVWLYLRFQLSLRDVEDLLAERGLDISYETVRLLEFFETFGRNLLAAEAAAGVRHHVALSIVGTDRSPDIGYFRAKVAQEKLIEAYCMKSTSSRAVRHCGRRHNRSWIWLLRGFAEGAR